MTNTMLAVMKLATKLKECGIAMDKTATELEKLANLDPEDSDYLAEIALSLAHKGRRIADIARKGKANRRSHLSVVGDEDR